MRSLESSSNQPLASPSIDEKLSAVDLKSKKKKMSDDASAANPAAAAAAAAAVATTKSESENVEAHSPQDEDVLGEMRDIRLRDRQRSNTLGGYRLGKKESSSSWSSSTAFGRLSSAFNVKTSSSKKDQQSQPQLQLHQQQQQLPQLQQQPYQQQAAELSKEEKAALKAAEKEQRQRAKAEKKNKDRSRKSKSPGAALSDGETTPTSFFSKERIVGGRFGSGFRSPPPRTDYTVSLPPLGTAASTANQHRSIFSINWNQGPSSTLPPRSPNRSSGPQSATSYITRGLGRFQLKRRNTSTLPPQQETERKLSQPPVPANFQNYGSLLRRHSVDPDRRRSVNRDRSLDDSLHHTALIHRAHSHGESAAYRCASGLASSESSICDRIDIEDLGVDETLLFVKFFRYYYCYDLIPLSAKLVVFDSQLLVKKAFFALVSNGVRAAPLWDSAQQSFVGMLTITDFIHILRKYYKSPMVRMDELEEHKIDTWRTVLTDMQRPLVSIGPDASLCDAITTLIHSKVHRLPVIDPQTGNVLYVLTHKRILRFLFLYFYDLPHASYLDKSIRELKVGTFDNIATCSPGTPLITALNMFIERRVSALPVVDEDNKVVDIYAKFDVINLASEKTYNNLDMSVGKALEFRNQDFEGVMTCQANDSLLQVMEKIVKAEVHRLVIVDEDDHVDGIVSLSDILTFLVLTPLGIERPASRAYYTRTTSSDRENGTVEEEPELEAKANAHGEQVVESERERQRHDSLDSQKTLSDGSRSKLGSRNNSEVGVPEEDEEGNQQQEQEQLQQTPPPTTTTTTTDDSPQSEEMAEASKSSDA